MPEYSWGNNSSPNGWSDNFVYTDGIGLPTGRAAANGSTAVIVTALWVYAAGRGATRTMSVSLAGISSGGFAVGAAGSAVGQPWVGAGPVLVNGGAGQFRLNLGGGGYFGRGGGGTVADSYGDTWGGTLSGGARYVTSPSAPQSLTATAHATVAGRIDLSWSAVADNGGTGVSGYNVYYSNGTFIGSTTSGSYSVTGLAQNTSFSFVVRAKNWVTDSVGSTSTNSNTATATTKGGSSAPRSFEAFVSTSQLGRVDLYWMAPATPGAGSITYQIYADGSPFATTSGTTFAATGLTQHSTIGWSVRAANQFNRDTGTWSAATSTYNMTNNGVPSAPRNYTHTQSTTELGRLNLDWDAPSTPGIGGITAYDIHMWGRKPGTTTIMTGQLYATVNGATTSFAATGLYEQTAYGFQVRARNQIATATGTQGTSASAPDQVAPYRSSAPRTLTSVASTTVEGRVTLSWTAPATIGSGGSTGYSIWQSPNIAKGDTTSTSINLDGLTPGSTYTFFVKAKSAVATASGVQSDASNTTTVLALGDPGIPTGVTVTSSTAVAGRLTVDWVAPVGGITITGYNLFANGVLLATLPASVTSYIIDGLTPGVSMSFYIRARSNLTDTNGSLGGDPSTTKTGTPGASTSQTLAASRTVANTTNSTYAGTYPITATPSSTTFSYSKSASTIPVLSIPAGAGTVLNNTNVLLNGTYTATTVGSIDTSTTLTYSRVLPDIPALTSVAQATALNTTNALFNGTYTVSSADSFNKTVSYAKVNSNVTSRESRGTVTNASNVIFNGTNIPITAVTEDTISYAKVNANVAAIPASGRVVNTTNRDVYNGEYTVTGTPTYDRFDYSKLAPGYPATPVTNLYVNPDFAASSGSTTTIRTNLITNPEVGVDAGWEVNWGTGGAGTRTISNASGPYPAYLIASWSATGTGGQHGVKIDTGNIAVSAFSTYTLSASVWSPAGVQMQLIIDWMDAGGAVLSSTTGALQSVGASIVSATRMSLTGAAPSGATQMRSRIVSATAPSTLVLAVSQALFELSSVSLPYFSGSTAAAGDFLYSWSGTANASSSLQTAPTAASSESVQNGFTHRIRSTEWSNNGTYSVRLKPSMVSPPSSNNTHMPLAGFSAASYLGKTLSAGATLRLTAPQTGSLHANARSIIMIVTSPAGTVTHTSGAAPNAAGVYELRVTGSIPADATYLSIRLFNGSPTRDEDVWWDDATVVEVPSITEPYSGPLFAGSTPAGGGVTFAWTGTADASTSVMTPVSTALTTILSPYGDAEGLNSKGILRVRYRSGWAG